MEQYRQRPRRPHGGTSYFYDDDTPTEPDNVSIISEHVGESPNLSTHESSSESPNTAFTVSRKPVPLTTSTTITPIPLPPLIVPRHKKRNSPLAAWWWEIAACGVAIAALLAVVATLRSYQDRPLPQLPFSISINALISIYSVIMKASIATVLATGLAQLAWTWMESDRPLYDLVAFDSASRGTLGALFLIWHVNIHQIVVLLGAVLTIFALAMDPFTQQLMQYIDCNTTVTNQVFTVPRTNYYVTSGGHITAISNTIPVDIQTAVNTGIFTGALAIDVGCSTGNCTTQQDYGSLAYCSSCEDISDQIQFTAYCSNQTFPENTTSCPDGTFPDITTTIPEGLSSTLNRSNYASEPLMKSGRTRHGSGVQFLLNKSVWGVSRVSPFTNQPIQGCDDPATNNTWQCRGYGAAHCSIYPCVRTYTSEVQLGVLNEQQIDQSPSDLQWSTDIQYDLTSIFAQSVLDLSCVSSSDHSKILAEGYSISPKQRWLPYNVTFDPSLDYSKNSSVQYPESLLAKKCLYIYDRLLTDNLWPNYLNTFFNATISGDTRTGVLAFLSGPQMLQTIYNYGDIDFERIDGIFANISHSMTNAIRRTGQVGNSAPAEGEVVHYATCLRVKWGWIAFPAAIVGITAIFCALAIATTVSRRSEIWKSNPLAMVYHGPFVNRGNGDGNGFGSNIRPVSDHNNNNSTSAADHDDDAARSMEEMDAAAKGLIVRLDKTDGRLKMSENQIRKRGRIKA